ncbi:MAG: peptide chain release factor-like protein [Mariniblastus sp.]|nr:peptide chain release factor-like protein [Mariniblastus sp.]
MKRTRGSGPGGQHRNKVETAIVITHDPTGVVGQASEKRSQNRNREVAIERLRVNLAVLIRAEVAQGELQSELWKSRIKSRKLVINPNHPDFASLLSEALDRIAAKEFDVKSAAERLGLSTSQLIKFLKLCPTAFQTLNRERVERGLRKLS